MANRNEPDHARHHVRQVVVAARGVVDRVAAAAGGAALQAHELREELRVVE